MKIFALTAVLGAALATAAGAAPPASLTIAASTTVVNYGSPVTLSGKLSTQKSNQAIGIGATECGKTQQSKAATVKTVAGGTYSAAVTPTIGTAYQATYKNVKSASVPVTVKPVLALSRSGATWTAKVTAGQALTGQAVLFQRYVKLHKRWKQVKRVLLTATTPGPAKPTVVSSATFAAKLARGTRVRLLITAAQAAPCYVTATSPSLRA